MSWTWRQWEASDSRYISELGFSYEDHNRGSILTTLGLVQNSQMASGWLRWEWGQAEGIEEEDGELCSACLSSRVDICEAHQETIEPQWLFNLGIQWESQGRGPAEI